jgi:hypothetical protein
MTTTASSWPPLVTAAVIYWILIRDAAASAPPPTCISSEPRRKGDLRHFGVPPVVALARPYTVSIAKPCQALRFRTLTGPRGTYLSTLILSHPFFPFSCFFVILLEM